MYDIVNASDSHQHFRRSVQLGDHSDDPRRPDTSPGRSSWPGGIMTD